MRKVRSIRVLAEARQAKHGLVAMMNAVSLRPDSRLKEKRRTCNRIPRQHTARAAAGACAGAKQRIRCLFP